MPRSTTLWDFTPTMLCPLNSTEPESGLMRPATVLSVVDLPAPLAPMSVTISPCLMSKEMPRTALMAP